MGPVRVTSRLLTSLMTLLVVTSLLPSTLSYKDTSICRFSCCTAVPNCDEAKRIDCICPGLDEMALTPDSIPASTTDLSISKLSNLTIGGDSFHRVNSLINFTVSDIGAVKIKRSGLRLHPKNSLHYFTARRIGSLDVDQHGLTGKWRELPQTTITFEDIEKLNIASRGFSYATSEDGPTVRVRNIATLSLASEAFDARIRDLHLENVNMPQCHWGTFDNKIDSLTLKTASIPDVKKRCFHSVGELGISLDRGVHITNSMLGTVKQEAFSGNITNIKIEQNTAIGKVSEHGFHVQVSDFIIENSQIGTLSSKSLAVKCKGTFTFKGVNIENLRTGAFKDVRATQQSTPEVSLESLEVGAAEPGSLSFQRCLYVDASELHIQLSEEDRCQPERWTRGILGATDQQVLYWEIDQLYRSLRECSKGCDKKDKPTLVVLIEDTSCLYSSDAKESHRNEINVNEQKGYVKTKEKEDQPDQDSHPEDEGKGEYDQVHDMASMGIANDGGVSDEEIIEGVSSNEKRPSGENEAPSENVAAGWQSATTLNRDVASSEQTDTELPDSGIARYNVHNRRPAAHPENSVSLKLRSSDQYSTLGQKTESKDATQHVIRKHVPNETKKDPYDVSYEYDQYWDEEEEMELLRGKRPQRYDARKKPSTNEEVDAGWRWATIALMVVLALAAVGWAGMKVWMKMKANYKSPKLEGEAAEKAGLNQKKADQTDSVKPRICARAC